MQVDGEEDEAAMRARLMPKSPSEQAMAKFEAYGAVAAPLIQLMQP